MALSLFDPVSFLFDDRDYAPVVAVRKDAAALTVPMRVDFKEEADKFLIHADIPGCAKGDVHVDIHERTLTLSAERHREETKDTDKYHRSERAYGKVTRAFRLPDNANTHSVAAQYDNGVLTVTIPKLSPEDMAPKSRRIEIA